MIQQDSTEQYQILKVSLLIIKYIDIRIVIIQCNNT